MEKLIKSTNNIEKSDLIVLREKFIADYSKKKGWNPTNLTPKQLLEIVEQNGYKSPGLIFG